MLLLMKMLSHTNMTMNIMTMYLLEHLLSSTLMIQLIKHNTCSRVILPVILLEPVTRQQLPRPGATKA